MCAKKVCPFRHPLLWLKVEWKKFKHRHMWRFDK